MEGCEKRYTDPSSLRKHVKSVHGLHTSSAEQNKQQLQHRPTTSCSSAQAPCVQIAPTNHGRANMVLPPVPCSQQPSGRAGEGVGGGSLQTDGGCRPIQPRQHHVALGSNVPLYVSQCLLKRFKLQISDRSFLYVGLQRHQTLQDCN